MRVIKTVIDIKGNKRFKKNGSTSVAVSQAGDVDPLMSNNDPFDAKKAKDDFRKRTQ